MSLKIKRRSAKSYEIVSIIGDASTDETYKLSKILDDLRAKGKNRLAIDMSEMSFIDSSALGLLILNWKLLKGREGELCLLSVNESMKEMLGNAKLDTVFRIVDSERDL